MMDNSICGYLFALGFFMGGLGILLFGIATAYDTWRGWQSDGEEKPVDLGFPSDKETAL